MTTNSCPTVSRPAVLVAGQASGQGKTTISAGLARAWREQGYTVQAFKCGPDFIDSMILQEATGRPVYNLDLGMCGEADGRRLLARAAETADVILVEGVMGLYDGKPSSADIAETFHLPVMLVIDANAMAQTFGAIATGLMHYRKGLLSAGVIANQVGSEGHMQLLRSSLPADIPWIAALPKDEQLHVPERHLGLFLAEEVLDLDTRIGLAARYLRSAGDIPLPSTVTFNALHEDAVPQLLLGKRIAIARDAAFCFIYQANIDTLQSMGAELTYFSPLQDDTLPEADAYWLPGGYPELHLNTLSQNTAMKAALNAAWQARKPILAECGGMMALCEFLNDTPAFGLLPGSSKISKKLQGLGTQSLRLPDLSAKAIHAHTYHYGVLETSLQPTSLATSAYGNGEAIYRHGSLIATFLHFYFPSNPLIAASLFQS